MTAQRKVLATALTILTVAGAGGSASAEWVVDAKGKCVERWSADSLLRGPTAMLMSPTVPFRNAAGVFTYQSPDTGGWTGQGAFFFWGPALALVSGAAGVVDTCVWLGTGLADTMT